MTGSFDLPITSLSLFMERIFNPKLFWLPITQMTLLLVTKTPQNYEQITLFQHFWVFQKLKSAVIGFHHVNIIPNILLSHCFSFTRGWFLNWRFVISLQSEQKSHKSSRCWKWTNKPTLGRHARKKWMNVYTTSGKTGFILLYSYVMIV